MLCEEASPLVEAQRSLAPLHLAEWMEKPWHLLSLLLDFTLLLVLGDHYVAEDHCFLRTLPYFDSVDS